MKISRIQLRKLILEAMQSDSDGDGRSDAAELRDIASNMGQDEEYPQDLNDRIEAVIDELGPESADVIAKKLGVSVDDIETAIFDDEGLRFRDEGAYITTQQSDIDIRNNSTR